MTVLKSRHRSATTGLIGCHVTLRRRRSALGTQSPK